MADTALESLTTLATSSRDDALIAKLAGEVQARQINKGSAYFGSLDYAVCRVEFGDDGMGGNTATIITTGSQKNLNCSSVDFNAGFVRVNFDNRFGIIGCVQAIADSNLAGLYDFGPSVVVGAALFKAGKIATATIVNPKTETALRGGGFYMMAAMWPKPT